MKLDQIGSKIASCVAHDWQAGLNLVHKQASARLFFHVGLRKAPQKTNRLTLQLMSNLQLLDALIRCNSNVLESSYCILFQGRLYSSNVHYLSRLGCMSTPEQIQAILQVGLAFARNIEGCSDALEILAAMGLTPSSRGWVEELGQLLVPEALQRAASIANAFLMVLPAQVASHPPSAMLFDVLCLVAAWDCLKLSFLIILRAQKASGPQGEF